MELFPPMPLASWQDTKQTLHRFCQVVGKIRLAASARRNHWWNVPFHLSGRGITTRPMGQVDDNPIFAIDFDFIDHQLRISTLDSLAVTVPLQGQSVASFYDQTLQGLAGLGITVAIAHPHPFDLPDTDRPFGDDTEHASYDPAWATRYWRVLSRVNLVLEEFAARFSGKASPVHHFWHTFDIAHTRFSDRHVYQPPTADPVTREAYSQEVMSFGFWFGDDRSSEPAFYAYAAPEPAGLADEPLQPAAAWWDPRDDSHLAVLRYDDARTTSDPRATVLEFYESAYQAGARLAGWDIGRLACPGGITDPQLRRHQDAQHSWRTDPASLHPAQGVYQGLPRARRRSRNASLGEITVHRHEEGLMAASTSIEAATAVVEDATVRPFRIEVPQDEIDELRRRVLATRWPDKETVSDRSQGVQLAKLRPLVEYWGTSYDWRKVEARLNALPQFVADIDGLDIQFAHIRSPHDDALPLLMTHGWPGSIIELLKVIDLLANPTVHGGRAADAFHLVLPTMPGYGFSGRPTTTGWSPARMARAFHELMVRLGYPRYVSQGGDWGAIISELLAVQAPEGLLGIHVNMAGTVPPEVLRHLRNFDPAPAKLSDREKAAYERLLHFYRDGFGYAAMMNQSPQTIGYALADSPVAMAAYYYDKFAEWTDSGGEPEKALSYDEMLDAISLYWLTNTGTSSSRSYWEGAQAGGGPFDAFDIPSLPVAVTVFPAEIYRAPRSWGKRAFGNLIYWNEVDRGGHFAAWEQPQLFSEEVRAAFRSLR